MMLECKVCREPMAMERFNYGGMSCLSCRSFFRRIVCRGLDRICRNQSRCELNVKNRTDCIPCRYNRCIEAGLKPELVHKEEAQSRSRGGGAGSASNDNQDTASTGFVSFPGSSNRDEGFSRFGSESFNATEDTSSQGGWVDNNFSQRHGRQSVIQQNPTFGNNGDSSPEQRSPNAYTHKKFGFNFK